jgi:histidinol-phosphatase
MSARNAGEDLALAIELADRADVISTERFRAADLRVDTKADLTPVTEADQRIEAMVRERIGAARPGDGVLGEEAGSTGDGEWQWVVDPIDGTGNFARGVPVWATLLSLRHEDDEVCAVVSAPALGRRWWAARGAGAWCNGDRIAVSKVSTLADATISFTDVRDFATYGWEPGFTALAGECARTRGFGDFWSHMLVAEGSVDCGIEAVVNEWDVSAVRLIVREAGGRFSDLAGVDHCRGGNVVTSNGLLHDAVLDALARRG